MNDTIKTIYDPINDLWGNPQTYKNIDFHPLKVKDIKYKTLFYKLFAQPKNYIREKKILKLSYLKFLFYVLDRDSNVDGELKDFLSHITKKEVKIETRLIKLTDEIVLENIALRILIGDAEFLEDEFENIREIVLEQNGLTIEYVEGYLPDLEEKLGRTIENTEIDYIDELFTFSILMKKSMEEIGEYTVFQLNNMLERVFVLKQHDIYQPLLATGQITMKNGGSIKPYLYHIGKRGRYDSILISRDKFASDTKEFFKS